jgi:hypothetical protein
VFKLVSLSHQLLPVQSRSAPHAHVTAEASVLSVVPSVEAQAGVGPAVVVTPSSLSGGGETKYLTDTVCETLSMILVSDRISVMVVVDVHVVEQSALAADSVPQVPQSLLQKLGVAEQYVPLTPHVQAVACDVPSVVAQSGSVKQRSPASVPATVETQYLFAGHNGPLTLVLVRHRQVGLF